MTDVPTTNGDSSESSGEANGEARGEGGVAVKLGRKDFLTYCIKGYTGWGRDDAFQRGCGRSRMPY